MSGHVWITLDVVLAVRDRQIAEHGGSTGVRDTGLLESTMARPRNLALHRDADVHDLAAAYAQGLARNHCFMDGNKRTAYVIGLLFLRLNGLEITLPPAERVLLFERLASGDIDQGQLARIFRENST